MSNLQGIKKDNSDNILKSFGIEDDDLMKSRTAGAKDKKKRKHKGEEENEHYSKKGTFATVNKEDESKLTSDVKKWANLVTRYDEESHKKADSLAVGLAKYGILKKEEDSSGYAYYDLKSVSGSFQFKKKIKEILDDIL